MPQSLSRVILHIIFSTKNRELWLDSEVRPRMHAYLATICRDLDVEFVQVGGVADHVHLVTTLPRTLSQAQLIEQITKLSSKRIKALDVRYRGFFWQHGYGAFSVSPSAHSKKSTVSCFASTAWISTSATSGIEALDESRFQRFYAVCSNPWGDAPG